MNVTISFDIFDIDSVKAASDKLKSYYRRLDRQGNEVCQRLAQIGQTTATQGFSGARYDGTNDVSVSVEQIDRGSRINASGNAVLFIEYGSGITLGSGHPEPNGYGPGTYPSEKQHWNDPKGWWYAHDRHTYGNPPAAAMYEAEQEVLRNIDRIANEVIGHD